MYVRYHIGTTGENGRERPVVKASHICCRDFGSCNCPFLNSVGASAANFEQWDAFLKHAETAYWHGQSRSPTARVNSLFDRVEPLGETEELDLLMSSPC